MTQAGGPAAINGFLYQIIHHIGWLADVTLTGKLDGQEIQDACLVLEPRSGGDARAEASGIYLVEQYKTRKDGTWALSDIETVLCDLRKAVPPSRPTNACYRFVTDGRPGRLDTFSAFLADVKSVAVPDDLDDTKKRHFRTDFAATNREFFDYILDATPVARRSLTGQFLPVVGYRITCAFEVAAYGIAHTTSAPDWTIGTLLKTKRSAMQELHCARCDTPRKLGVPRLINGVWFALCPACGVENELEPTVEEPVTGPTFRVIGVLEGQK